MNHVELVGRLTRDPEVKQFSNSSKVQFSIAVERVYTKNGEKQKETTFVDVEAWGWVCDYVAALCQKGQPVVVIGSLKQESWEKDGVKRTKMLVNASSVYAYVLKPSDSAPRASDGLNYDRPLPQQNAFDSASQGVADDSAMLF